MTTRQGPRLVNGVDVDSLKETISSLKTNPELAKFRFQCHNDWQNSSHNRSRIGSYYGAGEQHPHPDTFRLDCDEPKVLLGDDESPNPVEYLLHALAGCVTTTTAFHAASRGIRIDSIETTIEGDIDVRGFLGLTDEVPRGYQNLRVRMKIQSDAPPEKLAELAGYSPVYNSVTNGVPVDLKIETA